MVVIENMPPPQPRPVLVASAPAGADGRGRTFEVALPDRIPAGCLQETSVAYKINPLLILAVLKVESNGRTGIVARNTNGTDDLGPSQFNTESWAKVLIVKYKIPRDALINNMCQAVRALGFALRTEINAARGDLWQGLGNYHSHTPAYHSRYKALVWGAYTDMIKRGKF